MIRVIHTRAPQVRSSTLCCRLALSQLPDEQQLIIIYTDVDRSRHHTISSRPEQSHSGIISHVDH